MTSSSVARKRWKRHRKARNTARAQEGVYLKNRTSRQPTHEGLSVVITLTHRVDAVPLHDRSWLPSVTPA
ncbi:MAG TPA: hypothetical protein PLM08_25120, partial [Polyangiaceae bacterium]|nr:hypothetical protein [Polyangiaceae bacterium]